MLKNVCLVCLFNVLTIDNSKQQQQQQQQVLLAKDANVNIKSKAGCTPLHLVSSRGLMNIVEQLVNNGAVVDVRDNKCIVPAGYAFQNGHTSVVQWLLHRKNTQTHKHIF